MASRYVSIVVLSSILLFNMLVCLGLALQAGSYPSSSFTPDSLATNFLVRVAGVNISNYAGLSTKLNDNSNSRSQRRQSSVIVELGNDSNSPEASMLFVDDKLWDYELYSFSQQSAGGKTLNQCLAIASNAMNAYGDLFNVTYPYDLANMVSVALQSRSLTIENDRALLRISYNESSYSDFTRLEWYKKIGNGSTTQYQSIYLTVSRNGLLNEFTDYLAAYHVVNTSINFCAADVVNASTPLAQAYARANGFEIMSSEVRLEWWRDYDFNRGSDEFAVYPMWVFTAEYNETKQDVFGYEALEWADNGQVFWSGPEAMFMSTPGAAATPTTGANATTYPLLLLATIPAVVFIACSGTYLKRRKKKERSR